MSDEYKKKFLTHHSLLITLKTNGEPRRPPEHDEGEHDSGGCRRWARQAREK
jgi:hypothetical protein